MIEEALKTAKPTGDYLSALVTGASSKYISFKVHVMLISVGIRVRMIRTVGYSREKHGNKKSRSN